MTHQNKPTHIKDTAVPTVKQVAILAKVSTATVSRVLSGAGGVSDRLIEKVKEASNSLNYHPNRAARNLRTRSTQSVGVVVPDIENPFFTNVVHGIEETLQIAGYTWLLCNSNEDIERERKHLNNLIAENAAGIIIAPTNYEPISQVYSTIQEKGIALVFFDRIPYDVNIDSVTVSNQEGTRAAVFHLIDQGYQEIGLIGGPLHLSTFTERQKGYEQALATRGIPINPGFIQVGNLRQEGGFTSMQNLLELPKPPRAVLITNNMMTLGALQAIHQRNLRIPYDIAVVGFDDMPWATSLQPPLTAVSQPTYELGITAAKLLIERIKDPSLPTRHITLETKLIIRASCGGYKYLAAGDYSLKITNE